MSCHREKMTIIHCLIYDLMTTTTNVYYYKDNCCKASATSQGQQEIMRNVIQSLADCSPCIAKYPMCVPFTHVNTFIPFQATHQWTEFKVGVAHSPIILLDFPCLDWNKLSAFYTYTPRTQWWCMHDQDVPKKNSSWLNGRLGTQHSSWSTVMTSPWPHRVPFAQRTVGRPLVRLQSCFLFL
jgi:hypothetical protein